MLWGNFLPMYTGILRPTLHLSVSTGFVPYNAGRFLWMERRFLLKKSVRGFFLALFRGSLILTALDRLSHTIYRSFANGFFGWLFTGYPENASFALAERFRGLGRFFAALRSAFNRAVENSLCVLLIEGIMRRFLRCRVRVFGVFAVSFGAYTACASLVRILMRDGVISLADSPELYFALFIVVLSIPLIISKTTLADALCGSYTGRAVLAILGYRPEQVMLAGEGLVVSRLNVAFLCGLVMGVLTYSVSPVLLVLGLCGIVFAYLILCKPEIGVMTLCFAMPFLPTMALAALVIYVFLCFSLKVFRGKRIIRWEPLDVMVAAFAVVLFCGGTVSFSSASLKPALLFVCFLAAYFEAVWLLRDREWVVRCSVAAVVSAALVSLYGVYQYVTGSSVMAEAWVDSEMFASISGRAVSTLENPNMLGEYLILLIPLAVGMFIGYGEGLRRIPALFCVGCMGVCLLMTWSRGAWLGLIGAALLFLFIWHRRAVWLIFAGIASIPVLPYILPASIIGRFTSIGNLGDSSTSYRMYIWRASCEMIRDYGWTGIGIGEGAWDKVYPMYAYLGVETAPHSHNLFLQIWLETGIGGLLIFVAVLFLMVQSVFTLYRRLYTAREVHCPSTMEDTAGDSTAERNRQDMRNRAQIRIFSASLLCGIFAVLIQGMTDYAWYNYRVYLMFWLVIGLTAASVRSAETYINNDVIESADSASVDLPCRKKGVVRPVSGTKRGGNRT